MVVCIVNKYVKFENIDWIIPFAIQQQQYKTQQYKIYIRQPEALEIILFSLSECEHATRSHSLAL